MYDQANYASNSIYCVFSNSQDGLFDVESRHVVKNGAQEEFPLVDTDFAFAWVDFHYPMGPQFRDDLRATCRTGVCCALGVPFFFVNKEGAREVQF